MLPLDLIKPEEKDFKRARHLGIKKKCFNPNDTPLQGKADSMAKLITDKSKLVRRAKAMVAYWGKEDIKGEINGIQVQVNVWKPFAKRLESLGFSWSQIEKIGNYKHPDEFELLGLEDLLI